MAGYFPPTFQKLSTSECMSDPISFVFTYILYCQNNMQLTLQADVPTPVGSRKIIPDKKDRDAWWAFVSGEPETVWNPVKKPKVPKAPKPKGNMGMRGFSGSIPYDDVQVATSSSQTWTVNDVGDVELVSIEQTPSDTAAPTGVPEKPDGEAPSTAADPIPPSAKTIQREPTPSLLRVMDHVSKLFRYLAVV